MLLYEEITKEELAKQHRKEHKKQKRRKKKEKKAEEKENNCEVRIKIYIFLPKRAEIVKKIIGNFFKTIILFLFKAHFSGHIKYYKK